MVAEVYSLSSPTLPINSHSLEEVKIFVGCLLAHPHSIQNIIWTEENWGHEEAPPRVAAGPHSPFPSEEIS